MAALAALYPAKLQKVAAFDRFGHYRLETGEQLLVWTPIYPAGPLPLIIYLHGASSRGDDIQEIFEKGPGCPPALLRAGEIAPRAVVVAPLLAAKREWCKTSREAATTLRIIDAYFAEEARGAMAAVDRSRVYVTGPSCGGLGAYTLAARLARRGDGFSDRCPPAAAVVPVCGGGNVVFAPLLAKTPCWFWHSESDSAVPCSDTEALVAALEKLDAPVRFTKLTDEETPESPPYVAYMEHHNAWTPAYKVDSPMWAWLFAQSRGEGA